MLLPLMLADGYFLACAGRQGVDWQESTALITSISVHEHVTHLLHLNDCNLETDEPLAIMVVHQKMRIERYKSNQDELLATMEPSLQSHYPRSSELCIK